MLERLAQYAAMKKKGDTRTAVLNFGDFMNAVSEEFGEFELENHLRLKFLQE